MPTISIYLTKQNYLEVQNEENISAYINELISIDKRTPRGDSVNGKPVVSKTTTVGSTPASPAKIENPNACKECGHMKTAGRCINKNCKLKGKLQ